MKIAVTGATGFLGRHVLAELTRRGHRCTLLVRPGTARPEDFAAHSMARFDLTDARSDAYELLGRPDVVLHLAWEGLPNYESRRHLDVELPHQMRFLSSLVRGGLPQLVVSGTCFEYGPGPGELREDSPTSPVNAYGQAKDHLRRFLTDLQRQDRFNLIWARLFYVYGEGQAPHSLYSQVKRAVAERRPHFELLNSQHVLDYLPVEAMAKDLVALTVSGKDVGAVNVCSGRPVSVRQLVDRWIAENSWDITTGAGAHSSAPADPVAFWGSREKLRGILGKSCPRDL